MKTIRLLLLSVFLVLAAGSPAMADDSASPAGATNVRLQQRSALPPYGRQYIDIKGNSNPGKALGFDGSGILTAIEVGTGSGGGTGITDGDKGDLTVSGSGAAWLLDPGVVTLGKMANLAPSMLIGRATASTGVPEAITIGGGLTLTGTVLSATGFEEAPSVSLDGLPDGQEIRGATTASIVLGTGKGVGETTILAPWDVDGGVNGATRIVMTAGNDPKLEWIGANGVFRLGSTDVTMTSATATTLVNIAFASSKYIGGELTATTHANDASDFQAITQHLTFAAVNKAGTVTATIQATPATSTTAASAGTLTTAWTIVANGASVDIKNAANSSLAETTLKVSYSLTLNTDAAVVITP